MANPQMHKKKSKRVSTRKRTKIERKVREHHRKLKKEAKKNPRRRPKKDPGVPNSHPFKEQILREAEKQKEEKEQDREKTKTRQKNQRKRLMEKKRNLGDMVKDAEKRSSDFERKNAFVSEKAKEYTGGKAVESSLKAYYKEFRKVIEAADVVLQVLDARDPLGSRCPQVEEAVLSAGTEKRLVLLLNKIDMVPKENVEKWLKYLKNEFPAIAFKASTQEQSANLSHSKVSVAYASEDLRKSSKCLGADVLMKLLGNYCINKGVKTSIRVGVVGFPNTGKSSVINSLKRGKACVTGNTPGVTKTMQEVQLDKKIQLLDSPGIVMASGQSDSHTILRNCVKVETIEDPLPAVTAILKRCNKHQMMLQYNVADFADANEFLALLAARMGKLKKRGVPDITKAGKIVLQDWNNGKIRYYTQPPETHTMSTHLSAEIVTAMSKEFSVEELQTDINDTLKDLKPVSASDMMVESEGLTEGRIDDDGEKEEDMVDEEENEDPEEAEAEMDEGNLKSTVVSPAIKYPRAPKAPKAVVEEKKKEAALMKIAGNQQVGKAKKKELKKMKKQRKKSDKLAGNLSNALEGAFAGLGSASSEKGEDYNFSTDFL